MLVGQWSLVLLFYFNYKVMFTVEGKLIKLMFTQCSTLSATLGGVAEVLWTQVGRHWGGVRRSLPGEVKWTVMLITVKC